MCMYHRIFNHQHPSYRKRKIYFFITMALTIEKIAISIFILIHSTIANHERQEDVGRTTNKYKRSENKRS